MKKKIIHVYQQRIRQNIKKKPKDQEPPIIVRMGGKSHYGFTIEILGESKMVYQPQDPLACGARLWIETTAPVRLGSKSGKRMTTLP